MDESIWHDITLTLKQKLKIHLRIADEDAGYPLCEARYSCIEEYDEERAHGLPTFAHRLATLEAASAGAY